MSEFYPVIEDPAVGQFVKCHFPHMSKDPSTPSVNPHCALVVGIRYDEELGLPILRLAHSSREFESNLIAGRNFSDLVIEITGRVQITPTTNRIVNHELVVELPLCPEFFGEAAVNKQVIRLATASPEIVEKITAKLFPVNTAALQAYRMDREFKRTGGENWLKDLHDRNVKSGNTLG